MGRFACTHVVRTSTRIVECETLRMQLAPLKARCEVPRPRTKYIVALHQELSEQIAQATKALSTQAPSQHCFWLCQLAPNSSSMSSLTNNVPVDHRLCDTFLRGNAASRNICESWERCSFCISNLHPPVLANRDATPLGPTKHKSPRVHFH